MSIVASVPPAIEVHPNHNVAVSGSVISTVFAQRNGSQGSIMGGRNSQASLRTRNNASHWLASGRGLIEAIRSSNRIIKQQNARINNNEPVPGTSSKNESDSNADTCCLGDNFIVLSYTNTTADVYPYNDSYEPITNVPIVSGATTYHHPNGESYILIVNEALYYGNRLKHICSSTLIR